MTFVRRPAGRRARLLTLAAAVVLGTVLWGFSGRLWGSGGGEEWVEVRRGDLVLGVETRGTLAAVDSAFLGAPQIPDGWNQKISFMAPEGQEVTVGTPVLRFDTSDLERKLVEKEAEEGSAQKELEKRTASLSLERRNGELHAAEAEANLRKASLKVDVPAELVAGNDLAQSRADLTLAQREVEYLKGRLATTGRQGSAELAALAQRRDQAASRVAEIRRQIASMTVLAPRAGTVVYVSSRRSEKKKVGDTVWQSDKVLEIPDLGRMRADAEVDEDDSGRIAVGRPVNLRLDAHPELSFDGRVRAIHRAVQRRSDNSSQKVVAVEIELARTDPQRMRPGMRFQGFIETARVRGVTVAPVEAVTATAAGPRVRRRTLLGWEEVRPVLGRHNDRLVEVRSGLAPGDRIARGGVASETAGVAAAADEAKTSEGGGR